MARTGTNPTIRHGPALGKHHGADPLPPLAHGHHRTGRFRWGGPVADRGTEASRRRDGEGVVEFLVVPPPRFHLVRYHGVLAPAATWRSQIVPALPHDDSRDSDCSHPPATEESVPAAPSPAAQLFLGPVDASGVRHRRAGMSPLRRPPPDSRRDPIPRRHPQDSRLSRSAFPCSPHSTSDAPGPSRIGMGLRS